MVTISAGKGGAVPQVPEYPRRGDRPAAERQFVGREGSIAPVHAALRQPRRTKPLILVYYGGAGIGKSRLRMELVKQLAADPGVVTATLDFHIPTYRQPEAALFFMRNALHEAHQVRFPSFDLAYAVYWQKTHPDAPLREEVQPLLEPGFVLSQLLDQTGKLPLIGLIPMMAKGVSGRETETWWKERGERELEDLPQMEPQVIVEHLPKLWAADLQDHLDKTGDRAVLFIDSYEALWDVGSTEADFFKRDEWVREFVKQLPEVLWVVCGRQKLRWEEVEADWCDALSQHQLGALQEESARRFLESCDITNGQIQDAIVKGSRGVPHYLDLAADTVQSAKRKAQNVELRGTNPEELVEQFTSHLDKPEVETLKVLSAARFWYYGLFEHLITEYQTGYPPSGYDDLARFSFIKDGSAPGTRTMHELMREALQKDQAPELRKRVHLVLYEYYAKQLEGLNVRNLTDPHVVALSEAFYHGRQAKDTVELWAWFRLAAEVFQDHGYYRLLAPLYREMVERLEAELGPSNAGIAEAAMRLGIQLHEQGEFEAAETLYRRALAIVEKEHGPDHPLACDCMAWLTRLLRNRGRFDEAETVCRRALALFDKPGQDPTLTWDLLANLSSVLIESDKHAEAEEIARRSLAVSEKELGADHSHTADALNTLAYLMMLQRRYVEAEPLLRRALAIRTESLGVDNRVTMVPMDNLGRVLQCLCRYAEAEPLHRQALKISEETLGPDHPETAVVLNNLGTALREQGRYSEAEPVLRRALAVFEKRVGLDHPNPIVTVSHLINVLARRGRYSEAEQLALGAVAACEKRFGPDKPRTANALHDAGVAYGAQGRYAEAESFLRRSLQIRTEKEGPDHPSTLTTLDALASLDEHQGRHADAESLWRDVLEKRTLVLGTDHPGVANTAGQLAGICCRDGRYTEAEALYHRALAIREKVFGPDHPFTADTLEGLAKVCDGTGRSTEAKEFFARAKSIREQTART